MSMKNVLCLVIVCLLWSEASSQLYNGLNFDADLESWSSLKRRAGYYSQSGRYKGGLYKRASDEELEFYECIEDNGRFCLRWTARERSAGEVESGECTCNDEERHYCASWVCIQREVNFGEYYNEVHAEHTTCGCHAASTNGRYCRQWSCTEIGSDNAIEEEHYTCMRQHESRQYCDRWTGDIFSKKELESSVCQCDRNGVNQCDHWTCKEREIEICSEYKTSWCNLPLAVGLAGGLGTMCTLGALVLVILLPDVTNKGRVATFLAAFVTLCLPWTCAVAIWGGVDALIYVSGMWGLTFLISGVCLWVKRHD